MVNREGCAPEGAPLFINGQVCRSYESYLQMETGIRRNPDACWNKSAEEIAALPPWQGEILDSAAKALKAGGVLVYSTCTIDPSENDEVVEAFLNRHPEFTLEQTGDFLPVKRPDKMVQLYPQRDGTDGFFIARMRKAKG